MELGGQDICQLRRCFHRRWGQLGGKHPCQAFHCSEVMHNFIGTTVAQDAFVMFAMGRRALDSS